MKNQNKRPAECEICARSKWSITVKGNKPIRLCVECYEDDREFEDDLKAKEKK